MTEPRVEAGDRALETARKICAKVPYEIRTHELKLMTDEIQSAMNAQEWELDLLLPDSLNRPMSERIQGLKERADREANLAVELREALKNLVDSARRHKNGWMGAAVLDEHLAEAERLLAERGEGR